MLALARLTLKGPYQAAGVVGLLAILAIVVLPQISATTPSALLALAMYLVCVILVPLVVLTQGLASASKPLVAAAAGVIVAELLVTGSSEQGISMLLLQWLPLIVLAQVWRGSNSLAMTMLAGIALGVAGILLQYLFWTEMESVLMAQLLQGATDAPEPGSEQYQQFALAVRLLMLLLIASLYLTQIAIVLTARWMQARLSESAGFGQEFRALVLGKPAALVAMVVITLALWLQHAWMVSMALLFTIAFMFQGIAILHSRLGAKKQAVPLLVLYYLLLIVMSQIVGVLTAITGLIDNWLGFRGKPETPGDTN